MLFLQTVEKHVIASQRARWRGNPFSKMFCLYRVLRKNSCILRGRIPTVASLPRNDIDFFDTLKPPAQAGGLLLFFCGAAGCELHRQGDIGGGVVRVEKEPNGGLRHFRYRLDNG